MSKRTVPSAEEGGGAGGLRRDLVPESSVPAEDTLVVFSSVYLLLEVTEGWCQARTSGGWGARGPGHLLNWPIPKGKNKNHRFLTGHVPRTHRRIWISTWFLLPPSVSVPPDVRCCISPTLTPPPRPIIKEP